MLGPLNYLAHLLLAEDTPASRVGNLLGDFITGTPAVLAECLPRAIVQGIIRHREIDRFTDDHPLTARLKTLVAPSRRRFAGVIVDLIHDHFLTRHWTDHCPQALEVFAADCNAALREYSAILPAELGDTLEDRIADRWLEHYGTDAGMAEVFHRVARRRERFAPIRDAIEDLQTHRSEFEAGFHEFFPALRAWVRARGPEECG
jgi:acyl carrier protein phosphodiesterase